MQFLSRLVSQYRVAGWILVLLLSIPAVLGWSGWQPDRRARDRWASQEDRELLRKLRDRFSSGYSGMGNMLVLESDDFFQPERMDALHQLVKRLEARKEIKEVVWAGSIPEVTPLGCDHSFRLRGDSEATGRSPFAGSDHPLVRGQLMSEVGTTMVMYLIGSRYSRLDSLRTDSRRLLRDRIFEFD